MGPPSELYFLSGGTESAWQEILLMDPVDLAVPSLRPVEALDDDRPLPSELPVLDLRGRDAARAGEPQAEVLVERLKDHARDAWFDDVCGGGGAGAAEPFAGLLAKGDLSLVAAERPALVGRGPLGGGRFSLGDPVAYLPVRDGLQLAFPGERVLQGVVVADLHGARAVEADLLEQSEGVIWRYTGLAADSAAHLPVVGQ